MKIIGNFSKIFEVVLLDKLPRKCIIPNTICGGRDNTGQVNVIYTAFFKVFERLENGILLKKL